MVVRVGSAPATWQFRSRRRPFEGLALFLLCSWAWLMAIGLLIQIDGAANAKRPDLVQRSVDVLAIVVAIVAGAAIIVVVALRARPTVVAANLEGVTVIGTSRRAFPWSMVASVEVRPAGRSGRRVEPVLVLLNGVSIPIRGARSRLGKGDESRPGASSGSALPSGLAWDSAAARVVSVLGSRVGVSSRPVPVPPDPRRPAMVSELPGEPLFRRRNRDAVRPDVKLYGLGVLVMAVGRLALTLARAQTEGGRPFSWQLFALWFSITLASAAVLGVALLALSPAELAIGDTWLAQRRNFQRRWWLMGRETVCSVGVRAVGSRSNRGAGASTHVLVVEAASGRRVPISSALLDAGASEQLRRVLGRSPALFPQAADLLSIAGTPSSPAADARVGAVAEVRSDFVRSVTLLVSFVLVAAIAANLALANHADWVLVPIVVALPLLLWLTTGSLRALRSVKSEASPGPIAPPPPRRGLLVRRAVEVCLVLTVALAAYTVQRAAQAPPPGYTTATLTHTVEELPPLAYSLQSTPGGSISVAYAGHVLGLLWEERQSAISRLDPDQLRVVDEPGSEALATDIAEVELATVGQAPGSKIPDLPDLQQAVVIPPGDAYPMTFLGEVSTRSGQAGRQLVTLLVVQKNDAEAPWRVAFATDYTVEATVYPFLVPQSGRSQVESIAPGRIPGLLAGYWQSWVDKHRPSSAPFEPGPWTTSLGKELITIRQGGLVNGGLNIQTIEYRPGFGPWVFPGPFGSPMTCTGILAKAVYAAVPGRELRQDKYRSNWGGLLPAGYYRVITDVSVHPSCVAEQPNGTLLVIGGDLVELSTTGSR